MPACPEISWSRPTPRSFWPIAKFWSPPCRPESGQAQAGVAAAARAALFFELAVYPKPGLVSFVDSGSHADMDAATFLASMDAVGPFFGQIRRAAAAGADLPRLQRIGLRAEACMLAATGGVNTHKGAIFILGLLAAAHAALAPQGRPVTAQALCAGVRRLFGPAILASYPAVPITTGERLHQKAGVGGVRQEAALGFPCIAQHGLPALRQTLAAGADPLTAGVQAFFAILARVEDTTLLGRGGRAGQDFARTRAWAFLKAGGVLAPGWRQTAQSLHRNFIARNLSAGGAADLLAATFFCHSLEEDIP